MTIQTKGRALLLIAAIILCFGAKSALAQESPGMFVPLIGITSVPEPLALPKEGGAVIYHYAVKSFLEEAPLTDVQVVDNACAPLVYTGGDDNGNSLLESSETWRYVCTSMLSETTRSTATAKGSSNGIVAKHEAYTTVAVGSDTPPPLVSIINITKVAYPLSLPTDGGPITFTYRVSNPGDVPLADVSVIDDKCRDMSGKLGDVNGNGLLDTHEVWIYTCTTILKRTMTNTVTVRGNANGFKAIGSATLTVKVAFPTSTAAAASPKFPETGEVLSMKIVIWGILSVMLAFLLGCFFEAREKTKRIPPKKGMTGAKWLFLALLGAGLLATGVYPRALTELHRNGGLSLETGWKYPVARFPMTGPNSIAYSDIRDPGGLPQGLPVRLRIPAINVDSAIEDALLTPDGRMDVPAGSRNVAWFALGPHPGQEGSAVIGGHFGIQSGTPFVFFNLDKLKIGDAVYVVDDKGARLAFKVRKIALFERDADATTVFTSDDGLAHLNLITCEGIWNQVNGVYPLRRVVFTDALTDDGTIGVGTAPHRSLAIGTSGSDVTELQTALEQQGLLTMPRGAAKGYFGTLTRLAVAAYQKSVGLPSSGVFDLTTRARLIPPSKTFPALSTAGTEPATSTGEEAGSSSAPERPPTFLQAFAQAARGLFATPLDAFITSFPLISISALLYALARLRSRRHQLEASEQTEAPRR